MGGVCFKWRSNRIIPKTLNALRNDFRGQLEGVDLWGSLSGKKCQQMPTIWAFNFVKNFKKGNTTRNRPRSFV